jgi:hypothetical protein
MQTNINASSCDSPRLPRDTTSATVSTTLSVRRSPPYFLQISVPDIIYTSGEAEYILQSAQELWSARLAENIAAQLQFEQAFEELMHAKQELQKAELLIGEARSTIRHSGFGSILVTHSHFPMYNFPSE